jgi:hypothetical protein
MSTFANKFLKALKEDTEGNAFIKAVADAKEAGKKLTTVDGKKVPVKINKSAADKIEGIKEKHMTPMQKKMRSKLGKELPTNAFTSKYGKKEGKKIKYATATKMAMHKENVMEAPAADAPAQNDDTAAWEKSLDKGTNPKDFETPDNPQHTIDTTGIQAAHEWIQKLEEMAHFVNGTGPESLNSQINQLEIKNSVPFRGIVRREEKRITKLAENLRGLAEVFKSVVITSEKKIKDVNSPR